jgi:GST-like protein
MTALKLYGAQASGSIAVEAALTLLDIPYDLVEGTTWADADARDRVAGTNPMRQIPTIIHPSGEIMTESAAILIDLADRRPKSKLAPAIDDPKRRQFLRWMLYVSSAIVIACAEENEGA